MNPIKLSNGQAASGTSKRGTDAPIKEDKDMSDLEKRLQAIAIRKQDRRRRQTQMKAKKRKVLLEYYEALQQIEKHGTKIIQLIHRRKKSLEPRISQLTESTQPQGIIEPTQ